MENNYFSSDERIIKLEEGLITEDLTEIIIHKSETIHSFLSEQQYGHTNRKNWFIYPS